jgi:hypothetical protein
MAARPDAESVDARVECREGTVCLCVGSNQWFEFRDPEFGMRLGYRLFEACRDVVRATSDRDAGGMP